MKKFITILIILISINGCKKDNPVFSENSPFQGKWSITFIVGGSSVFDINNQGQFEFGVAIGTVQCSVKGGVGDDGNVNADMTGGGYLGSMSGNLTGNTGIGSWELTAYSSGTWIMSKVTR
jgi:hypothetical protein